MKAPWEKFSLPAEAAAYACGRSPEFTKAIREIFGPLVERVGEPPAGPLSWVMAEVPAEGSLSAFFRRLAEALDPRGSLWTVLPKKPFAAALAFPYLWLDVQKAGLAAGLVDDRVAAFSPRLTAIRFVVPLSRRPRRSG